MYANNHNQTEREYVFLIIVCVSIIIALSGTLIANAVRQASNHVKGTLTAYDMNLNPKFALSGDFEQTDENTWLDRNTGTYYTFDRAILEAD